MNQTLALDFMAGTLYMTTFEEWRIATGALGWLWLRFSRRAGPFCNIYASAVTANAYLDHNVINPPGWRRAEPRPVPWPVPIRLRASEVERSW